MNTLTRTTTSTLTLALILLGARAQAQDADLVIDLGAGVTLDLVMVKPGTFQQGSPTTEAGRGADEAARVVTLSRAFYMGKAPVTRGQFARFAQETSYRTEAEKGTSGGFGFDGVGGLVQKKEFNWRNPGFAQADDHPVTIVTYGDAVAFAAWASQKAGREVTLPTEAQYEYAARAGTNTRFHGGDADAVAGAIGWFKGNAGRGTQPVAKKTPNAFGLFDTSGNVYEWCRDFYGAYPTGAVTDPEQTTPPPGEDKARRVLRGGSWLKDAKALRSAARYRNDPGSRNADNGFRVTASVDKRAQPAPAAPLPGPATPSSGGDDASAGGAVAGALGLVLGGGCCLGLFGLVLWAILRNRVGTGSVRFRMGADGFWVDAPDKLRGCELAWHGTVGGSYRHGDLILEPAPGGQFVYTGAQPTNVRAASVKRPAAAATAQHGRRAWVHGVDHDDDWNRRQHHSHHHDPYRGNPSAY